MIVALAISGMIYCGAEAQTRTCHCPAKKAKTHAVAHTTQQSHAAKLGNTYQVCREQGGYYTCCVHKKTALATW